ncbi:PucR family transcriptional regulator [Streptomyces sp. NPDC057623]|uniref:PucR family transcriptional regulator n=1 Tax=Streptomyces sp. NPDC057623 TaxID=3346187 RepID=UPI0036839B62
MPVPEPVADPELVDTVLRRLGPGAVAWAAQVGAEVAARLSEGIPPLGNDPTLPPATESITLSALLEMSGVGAVPAITDDAKRNITQCANGEITLEELVNGLRLGHACMSEVFLAACEQLAPLERRGASLRSVSARLFQHWDRFARTASEIYSQEHARFTASPAAARVRAVQDLLSRDEGSLAPRGGLIDEFEGVLQYSLQQVHQAVVLSHDGSGSSTVGAEDLRRLGYRIARASQSPQRLVHPTEDEVWVWLGGVGRGLEAVDPAVSLPGGVVVSVGGCGAGVAGFRTTLRQACEVRDLRARVSSPPALWRYRDLEVVLLMAADFPRARAFVAGRLDGLLGRDRQAAELRHTLKTYFDAHSSPNETARRLHIARNTVSARVHKAAECLGRDFAGDIFDLHAALVLADVFGDEILRQG